jgi:pimeloyl-ACP methyl ester carboxylesterase
MLACASTIGGAAAAGPQDRRGPEPVLGPILSQVDESVVPTGILYDRIMPLSRIDQHDGSKTSRPLDTAHWKQIAFEMSRASLGKPHWPGVQSLLERLRDPIREGIVPVSFLNFKYNRIRPGALADGSLVIDGARLIVRGHDAFIESRVFAVAALKHYTHRGEQVVFMLDEGLFLTNDSTMPKRLEIDFDDGRGFRAAAFGENATVHYASPGRKLIRVSVLFEDETSLVGGFHFRVAHLQTPTPHDTLSITATIPYGGEFGSGEAYVYLSDSHLSLTNPVVVIEGFDLDNSLNWDELYHLLNRENLLETLRGEGFDAVVLNFTEATEYIQKNGLVVIELLQQVQDAIDPQVQFVVIGASMGGLVARFALLYMEKGFIDHRVRTLISFDSPQNGANIPLGLQYWLKFFSGQSAEAAFLLSRLDTRAARQMLVYHHTDPPGTTGESDLLRAFMLNDFATLGQYPANPRKVAMANGSGHQAGQGFSAGDQIIDYEYGSFLVDITGNVWAVPNGTGQDIFDGLIDIILLPKVEITVTVSGTLPYDNAPGGSRASMAEMDSTQAPYGDIVALYGSHCFVPTISALALDTPDLFYDIAGDSNILALTPFDAVYYPAENQEHIAITPENAGWLLMEILPEPTGVAMDARGLPGRPLLSQNFPNPFNPETRIRFDLPRETFVDLTVFSVDGGKVATLIQRPLPGGTHIVRWWGRDNRSRTVASGVYFYRLVAGTHIETRRMVLIK